MRKPLFILCVCLMFSPISFAALNAYLTLEGQNQGPIQGGVTQAGREYTIEVNGFSHLVFSPRSQKTGFPTGQFQHEPLRITKKIDRSTPLLMAAWANNELLTTFELRFYQPTSSGAEQQHYTIILNGAYIVSVRQEMLNNQYPEYLSHKEREHVTFVYNSIEWVYENTLTATQDEWEYAGAGILISDLNGDGLVNMLDLAIMADEWLITAQ